MKIHSFSQKNKRVKKKILFNPFQWIRSDKQIIKVSVLAKPLNTVDCMSTNNRCGETSPPKKYKLAGRHTRNQRQSPLLFSRRGLGVVLFPGCGIRVRKLKRAKRALPFELE